MGGCRVGVPGTGSGAGPGAAGVGGESPARTQPPAPPSAQLPARSPLLGRADHRQARPCRGVRQRLGAGQAGPKPNTGRGLAPAARLGPRLSPASCSTAGSRGGLPLPGPATLPPASPSATGPAAELLAWRPALGVACAGGPDIHLAGGCWLGRGGSRSPTRHRSRPPGSCEKVNTNPGWINTAGGDGGGATARLGSTLRSLPSSPSPIPTHARTRGHWSCPQPQGW